MRTRNKLLICATALMVPLCTWAQTEVEPNNSYAQATPMTYQTAMTGTIAGNCDPTAGNDDYFRLTTTDQDVLRIVTSMSNNQLQDKPISVRLLNSSYSQLEAFSATAGANGVAHADTFLYRCAGIGTYYLYIPYPGGSACVNYSLVFDVLPPVFGGDAEPNNSSAQVTDTLSAGVDRDGRIEFYYEDNYDYHRILAPNDGVMTVNIAAEHAGTATGTMVLRLLNSSTSTIETWTVNVGAGGVAQNNVFTHTCTGTENVYYLYVYDPTVCGVSYRLNYTVAPPVFADDDEPNNGSTQVTDTLSAGVDQDGRLDFDYDDNIDYHRILAPNDGVMTVNIAAEHAGMVAGTMTLYLRNSSTSSIETWTVNVGANGVAQNNVFTHTCTGTENVYYLEVYSPALCGVSYRLNYTVAPPVFADDDEPNNGSTQVTDTLSAGVDQDGRLDFDYDDNIDYHRILAPNDGVMTVNIAAENAGMAAGTMTLYLRNSSTSSIETWTVNVGANGVAQNNVYTHTCTGTENVYYLEVYSPALCGVSYRLNYTVAPPVFADDAEPNDNHLQATTIDLNAGPVEGRLEFNYDNYTDYYRVNHPGGPLRVITSAENAGAPGTMTVYIRNSSTSALVTNTTVLVGGNSTPALDTTTLASAAAGIYYIELYNPTVCGVSYRMECYDDDNDGVCNASDLCPGTPTGEGVNATGCSCSQVLVEDGDPCTLDECLNGDVTHTFQDADNDGTCDATDGCPNDPGKTAPGACGCGTADVATTWYADADGDGLGDPNSSLAGFTCNQPVGYVADNSDACPAVSGTEGSACDDGDAQTTGDALDANCNCVGTSVSCDDGDPCTLDAWDGTQCVHTFQDADGDGTCDATDGCPNDPGKTAPGACGCGTADVATTWYADADGDGLGDPNSSLAGFTCSQPVGYVADNSDACPAVSGTVGSACDDGDAQTTGDALDANCNCVGTTIGGPCTGNQVLVNITGGSTGDLSWVLTDAGNTVATGGGTASTTACLGTTTGAACYGFRLTDSFGDGIANGGWELRTTDGKLILRDDFASGSQSPSATPASPAYGSNHSFCLPLGPANILASECGIFNNEPGNKVYCNKVTGATQYQFEFSDPDAGFIRRIARTTNYVHFNDMVANPLVPGVHYFARVRTNVSGPVASAHWGSGCDMGLTSTVPCSQLIQAPAYGHSCNETRAFNPPTNNSFIYANPVVGASQYQFRIFNSAEGYDQIFTRSTYILQLKWNNSVAPVLVNGSTYNVEVNVNIGGVWSGFCTSNCTITIDNGSNFASMEQTRFGEASMWPNPVRDGQVNLSLGGLKDAQQQISVDIQDLYGKQVFTQQFGNSGERFSTILQLPSTVASGVYLVNIAVNGERTVQRLSIIR